MRAYKREREVEKLLSEDFGLEHFIPKQKSIRSRNGKIVICMEPVIRSFVFVYATHKQIVDFKRYYCNDLQFVLWKSDDAPVYLTVPTGQMESFIKVCEQKEKEVHFYRPNEINIDTINIEKGQKVKVHGGPFDKVEGYFMKIAKKRGRQLVVIIPDLLIATAEVEPEFLEIVK